MNSCISFLNSFHSIALLLVLIFLAKSSNGIEQCGQFNCGELYKNISYPFRKTTQPEYCAPPGFVLDCEPETDHPLFEVKSQKFKILGIHSKSRVIEMARFDLSGKICIEKSTDTDFGSTPFKYTSKDRNATLLYGCDHEAESWPEPNILGLLSFPCSTKDNGSRLAYLFDKPSEADFLSKLCNVSVVVPVRDDALKRGIGAERVLEEGFEVQWTNMGEEKCLECLKRNGSCGYNKTVSDFMCICPPNHHHNSNWSCVDMTTSKSGTYFSIFLLFL